jgi:cephalosporin hydroxylase
MIDLKQLINDNMAVLDAELEHQEVLAEQKLFKSLTLMF